MMVGVLDGNAGAARFCQRIGMHRWAVEFVDLIEPPTVAG